jgi:hypothetical protein
LSGNPNGQKPRQGILDVVMMLIDAAADSGAAFDQMGRVP